MSERGLSKQLTRSFYNIKDNTRHKSVFAKSTHATRWLENGGGMKELRLILGHAKYDMVKRYAHVANSSIVKAAAKYSMTAKMDKL
jgi:site-specific recombinase XerD